MDEPTTSFPDELNVDQRRAVEHTDGPLIILAGPGTGKTRVTTAKLTYLIGEKGIPPDRILALTFSEKAATEMRDRAEELLPAGSPVEVRTFHSFCLGMVREHALELGVTTLGEVFTEEFQRAFILQGPDRFGLRHFTIPPRPMELARTLQGAIARFKQENIPVERLEEYLWGSGDEAAGRYPPARGTLEQGKEEGGHREKEEDRGENGPGDKGPDGDGNGQRGGEGDGAEERARLEDLARVYRGYEDFKRSRGLMDFGDMQLLALRLLRNWPAVAERYRKRFEYIIVDEFQDTDHIQLRLLLELAPGGNITVVGDDDQAIYRFRGAYLTNIAEFVKAYGDRGMEPSRILLRTNYRCTRNIQYVAGGLISRNPDRGEKEIEADRESPEPVRVIRYPTETEQARGIVGAIHRLHRGGAPWDACAILVRRRVDARPIIEELERTGTPYELLGSDPLFSYPVVRSLVSYLKVLEDPVTHGPSLAHLLLRPFHGLAPGEVPKLSRHARSLGVSLWESMDDLEGYDGDAPGLGAFRQRMGSLFALKGEQGLLPLVRALILGPEFMGAALAASDTGSVRLLNRFLNITARFVQIYPDASPADFLAHLDALRDLETEGDPRSPAGNRVRLLTVHGSKGMEFPHVFIPDLGKNRFPSRYRPYRIEIPADLREGPLPGADPAGIHLQEERRLLYVAITRARDSCHLSSCERYGTNVGETPPSVFIDEILDHGLGLKVLEPGIGPEDAWKRGSEPEEEGTGSRLPEGVWPHGVPDRVPGITGPGGGGTHAGLHGTGRNGLMHHGAGPCGPGGDGPGPYEAPSDGVLPERAPSDAAGHDGAGPDILTFLSPRTAPRPSQPGADNVPVVHGSPGDAALHRLMAGIHRGDWGDAMGWIAAMASLNGTDPASLSPPGEGEIGNRIQELRSSVRAPVRDHLEKIVYSPTRLATYETCPRQYWYGHVMGIPGEWKPFFALGAAVHGAIEVVTRKMMDGGSVALPEALGILHSLWDPSMYGSREMEERDRRDAEAMIGKFLDRQGGRGGQIIGVEEWVGLDLEGRRLRGKVDRIDLRPDGKLEVIDYKSSKRRTSKPMLRQDFQMALYWLGAEQGYSRKVERVGHWYLRMDQEWMVEISREELEAVRQRAVRVIEGIEAGRFDARPGFQTCDWCDYQMLCEERWR